VLLDPDVLQDQVQHARDGREVKHVRRSLPPRLEPPPYMTPPRVDLGAGRVAVGLVSAARSMDLAPRLA
jgi:hypothetical protein